ncbi:MAG: efflux RND transporter periplasmic adaptor subunit [Nitrosomonadales bacterium]
MNKIKLIAMYVAVISIVASGGYWLGSHAGSGRQEAGLRMQDTGSKPGEPRKILYYRNPMGLPDTSPTPKKDSMGMDYVAVYQGEATEEGLVSISVEKVQKLGVKREAAVLRDVNKTLNVSGRIEIDERRTYAIAPKFEGWVEHLYVSSTGQSVKRGEPLFDVYSPELVSAQREYRLARQGEETLKNAGSEASLGMGQLAEGARARLKNWDIADGQISQSGNSRRTLTYYAPATGIVMEKKAVQGMRFLPGETLYQIADLSRVWVIAEINEQDIGQISVGAVAQIRIAAYPDQTFEGKIAFIYPTLNAASRTVQVRVELDNQAGKLKPAMYASVTLQAAHHTEVLSVPVSAVIDSGKRTIVIVERAPGLFAPRTVIVGQRGDEYVEIRAGLAAGEQVVTSALFLIDAESNLKAALSGLGGADSASAEPVLAEDAPQPVSAKPVVPAAVKRPVAKTVGHQAVGVFNSINPDGSVSITHEAIKSLGWPGMTMDFALANASLSSGIKQGSAIRFEIVERKPDEWVITRLHVKADVSHEGH